MRFPHTVSKAALRVYQPPEGVQVPLSDDDLEPSEDEQDSDSDEKAKKKVEVPEEKNELGETDHIIWRRAEAVEEDEVTEGDQDLSSGEEEEEGVDASSTYWDEELVPALSELAIKSIANNYYIFSEEPLNKLLLPEDWDVLMEELPVDLALVLSVTIPESYFWKRACYEKYKKKSALSHGDSFKRMFMELNCQDMLEHLLPETQKTMHLTPLMELWEPYVKRLVIDQLLVGPLPNIENDPSNRQFGFIDLGPILPELKNLEELHIRYGEKECGLQFEWIKFEVFKEDMTVLGAAIAKLPGLRKLKICRSRIKDSLCDGFWDALHSYQPLEELDIVYCALGNQSVSRVADKLKADTFNELTRLDLTDNQITREGAQVLAKALAHKSCKLKFLCLKLNQIRSKGAIAIASALEQNEKLTQLDLSGCRLEPEAFVAFGQLLKRNSTLQSLELSSNDIDKNASYILVDGLDENDVIQDLGVLMTGIPPEYEIILRKCLDRNRKMLPDSQRYKTNFKDYLNEMIPLNVNGVDYPDSPPSPAPVSHHSSTASLSSD